MRRIALGLVTCVIGLGLVAWADDDASPGDAPLHAFAPVPNDAFRPSSLCARCHAEGRRASAMRSPDGEDISPVGLWQSSMMANASRDPFWHAAVAIEVAATPSRRAAIESACMRCHAPMADPDQSFAGLLLEGGGDRLGADGASCTVCHRIARDGLGRGDSFSGGWTIDKENRVFGPHAEPFSRPMQMHTGLLATESGHVLESALCATCHTLTTPALDPRGRATGGRLPEQTPYLEWLNSAYSTERSTRSPDARSCQDCHMPTTDVDGRPLRTRIARNPGGRDFPPTRERSPYGQHLLVGANALAPRILADNADLLDVAAPASAFERTLDAVDQQLRSAASLDLVGLELEATALALDLRITNHAGHRFPTAHPTRRAWLALRVLDPGGRVLFTSGAWDERGRIVGDDGKPLAAEGAGGPTYPHCDRVTSSADVALYEAQMVDAHGNPTWLLLRGERFVKDDRLLPKGWEQDGPYPAVTAPKGVEGDADFGAGDVVQFRIALPSDATGTLRVEAKLVHQVVGARWLAEWETYDLPEVRLLASLLRTQPPTPSVVSTLDVEVQRTE